MMRARDRAANQVVTTGSVMSAFQALRNDYDMAKDSRFRRRLTGYSPMGSGADYHIRNESDYLKMTELARAIDRNDIVVGQAVTRLVGNILQGGMQVDPDTGDEAIDSLLKDKWRIWSETPTYCDAAGESTFRKMARMGLRSMIVDGDHFFLPLNNGRLQMLESHRCRTPKNTKRNVVHGILLDAVTRFRLEYWFTNEDVEPMRSVGAVSEITRVSARDDRNNRMVFHLYDARRPSQTRGISAFAPVVNAIGMHDDIQFAKLVQQQVCSMFAIIRNRTEGYGYGANPATGASEDETLADGTTRTMTELAPGMELTGQPGETISGFSPNIPNAEYFEHVKMILTFVAINLGLPRQIMLLDPSDTNFSSWRGAVDQARQGFMEIQDLMIEQLYRPVYEWKIREWVVRDPRIGDALGRLGANLFRHFWTPPHWSYIDPTKDADADVTIIGNRLNSRREQLGKRGLDVESVDEDAANDQANWLMRCIEKANEINQRYPDAGITWRDINAITGVKASAPAVSAPTQDPQHMEQQPTGANP